MSAELLAIEKALEHAYSSDFSSIHIFSDSKPSLQSIFNNKPTNLNTVNSIRDIIFNFSSAGTQVSLVWIPSHVNIPGNELADRAAGDCLTSANSPTINNKLNAPELCSLLHAAHILRVSHTLDSRAPSLNLLARQKLGLFPWFLHKEKLVVKVLHRLRSDKNKLNKWAHRFNPELDGNCTQGCPEPEDTVHILVACPKLKSYRNALENLLSSNNLELTLVNIFGLNPEVNSNLQFKIRNSLIKFLRKTELLFHI